MKTEPVLKEVTVNVPVSKVWKAITDKDEMKNWYFEIEDFKPEVGFEFQFYGGSEEKRYLHLCKVIEVIPGKKLSYSWRYEDYPGESFVTFELFDKGDKTGVKLTHEGLESFPNNNPDLAKENFVDGWNQIIGTSLKDYLEKQIFTAKAEIKIKAPIAKVWEALIKPEIIKQYMFGTNVVSDWKEGSPIVFKGEWEGKKYEDKGVILKIEPKLLLQYSHFSPLSGLLDKQENYHSVTIKLSDEGKTHTLLSLTQDNNPTEEARKHSEKIWETMLTSLKTLLEK